MSRKVTVSFRRSRTQKEETGEKWSLRTSLLSPSLPWSRDRKITDFTQNVLKENCKTKLGVLLSVMSDLEIQEGYTVFQRCQTLQQPPTQAASILLLLFSSSHRSLCPPLPLHFVATVTLTLNSQVGRCRGRDTEAVARTAGVFPGILRLDPEDDEGAVDEDAHSELQITTRRHRRFCHTLKQDRPDIYFFSSISFFFFFFFFSFFFFGGWAAWGCHKRAAESRTAARLSERDPKNTQYRAGDSNKSANCNNRQMVQPSCPPPPPAPDTV